MGAVSGDINTLSMSVVDATDLASRPIANLRDGDRAYVTSRVGLPEGPLFFLNRTSTATVDGIGVLATLGGVGRWLSEAMYGGSDNTIIAADAAALASAATPGRESGSEAYVATFRSYFRLDRTSVAVPDQKTVIAAVGGGNWLRQELRDPTWSSQAAWEIDPASGDDENTGEPGAPLQTWAEFVRRVTTLGVSMTVTILDNIAENLVGEFGAVTNGLTLTVQGNPTVLATGTIAVVANPNPATNAEGTLTSASVADWTPYVGRIVECTSGAAATCQTVVMANVAGVAQIPFWARRTTFSNPLPVAGDTIRVLQLTTAPSAQFVTDNLALIVRYLDLTGTSWLNAIGGGSTPVFEACEVATVLVLTGLPITLFGCSRKAGGSFVGPVRTTFIGGGWFAALSPQNSGQFVCQGTISYAAVTIGGTGTQDNGNGPSLEINTGGLGIFNVAGTALAVRHGGRIGATGAIYGDGNTVGCQVEDGGIMQLTEALTPTITGVTEIQIDGQATVVPPLVAGDLAVPAASALTTWAQWAAAPFNRVAVNYAFTAAATGAASMARIVGR